MEVSREQTLKPTVAHFVRTFLAPTETFIHAMVSHHTGYHGVVCTRIYQHREKFPFPTVYEALPNLPGFSGRLATFGHDVLRTCLPPEAAFFEQAIRESQATIVHGHFGTDARYILPIAEKLGLPLVATFYGYDATSFPQKLGGLGAWYLSRLFREAAAVIAVSSVMREKLLAIGCPLDKLHLVHFGIALEQFPLVARPAPKDEVKLLSIGRLVPKKGHEYLLRAMAQLPKCNRTVSLKIAGDGILRPQLEELIRALGLGQRVQLLGHVSHDEVKRLLREAHVFVQPSVTPPSGDQEGVPTTLMEAMASGLPTIASRHAGIPDIVEHEVTGYLTDEGDVQGLATVLTQMANMKVGWDAFSEAARRRVETHFDATTQMKKIEEIYSQISHTCGKKT
jgi:glycosyltransferase involved in cell wall biosynthesis